MNKFSRIVAARVFSPHLVLLSAIWAGRWGFDLSSSDRSASFAKGAAT